MNDLDHTHELVKATLFALDQQLRPQDAYELVGEVERLQLTIGTLLSRISDRLASADRLPGLYSTASSDPRAELRQARTQLTAAAATAEDLAQRLDDAHHILSALGHGDLSHEPLTAVDDAQPEPPRHPGWTRPR